MQFFWYQINQVRDIVQIEIKKTSSLRFDLDIKRMQLFWYQTIQFRTLVHNRDKEIIIASI